jgi:hypothetical protein
VAVSSERFVGSRAIWRVETLRELFVTFARPDAIGLSAIAAQLEPVDRHDAHGLHVRLADPERAPVVLHVPIAPAVLARVGVAEYERLERGRRYPVARGAGSLAVDGERELELTPDDELELALEDGPVRIDVAWVMAEAVRLQRERGETMIRLESRRGERRAQ